MSRSEQFPTHYRVGSITDAFQVPRAVYWSPADGYGIERVHECLTAMPADDVAKIVWFDKDGDYAKLLEATDANAKLFDAMGRALVWAMADADEKAFAETCEADKAATLRQGSGV